MAGPGTAGWRVHVVLKSQIENAGEVGMGRGAQRGRIFKSQIEIAGEERMAGNGWTGDRGLKCKLKTHGRKA